MPDYFDSTTSSAFDVWVQVDTARIVQKYEEYVRAAKRQEQEWERYMMEEQQRMDEERQEQERIAEDKWRHPLFYWRELTKWQP